MNARNKPSKMTTEELLETKLKELEKLQLEHPGKAMLMLKADNSALFPLDLIAFSVFKRSMSLIAGFCLLIRQKNFICAAPLIRLQLDNALRFFATTLVKEPHKLAMEVIDGAHINKFTDEKTGKNLYDNYLVDKLNGLGPQFGWVSRLYSNSSGYIHLSEKHFFNLISFKENDTMKFSAIIGADDSLITLEDRLEAVEAMIKTTMVVMFLLDSWTFNKNNPGLKEQPPNNMEGK